MVLFVLNLEILLTVTNELHYFRHIFSRNIARCLHFWWSW